MENTIDIYTDASHYFGNNLKRHVLGYAGIIVDDERDYVLKGTISRNTIKNYFDLKCSDLSLGIEHGEMIAIAKSLWQFRKDSHNIRIFSDCLYGLTKINQKMRGKALKKKADRKKFNKIIQFIIDIINRIKSNGGSVELFWVKGHANCYGNELADQAAKDMFVPNFKARKMNSKEKRKFKSLGRKGSTYRNQMISSQAHSTVKSLSDKFFFDKETNEFSEYKEVLLMKQEVELVPNLSALEVYTETVKMSIQLELDKYKSLFKRIYGNVNRKRKTV